MPQILIKTQIKSLEQILEKNEIPPTSDWDLRLFKSDDCQSYGVWNKKTQEALFIDPKLEDWDAYLVFANELKNYLWLAVIDTHTHADHISVASKLSKVLNAPLVMHEKSPSCRIDLKVSSEIAKLSSRAGPIKMIYSPGHATDAITVLWGSFIFTGDTILYGDTGRDDLPGGDPTAHFESLERIKSIATPEMIVLTGHDQKDGRASSWKTQLEANASLSQSREDFIREASAFDGSPPKLLKESLRENFK